MYTAKIKITGNTPYQQGRKVMVEKLNKEQPADFEKRTWREKLHCDESGEVYIPLTALKNCLSDAAKYLSIQIPGKGKATYTKHFEAGVIVEDHIKLGINKKNVKEAWVFGDSMGKRGGGSGKRVEKCFPTIPAGWSGTTTIRVLDDIVTRDVLEQVLREAGRFVGLGVFRPRNNGYYGRFDVEFLD